MRETAPVSIETSNTDTIECTYPYVNLGNSGVAGTYGAYTEVFAALAYVVEVYGVYVFPTSGGVTNISAAIDFGLGAAGSETQGPTIPFLGVGDGTAGGQFISLPTPYRVTNARLAARMKSTSTTVNIRIAPAWRRA